MENSRPILVATCGNADAGDDAFGPLVAAELRGRALPTIDVLDLGINPAALLDRLPGRQMLIVVDAVDCPGVGGELLDIDWFAPGRPRLGAESAWSTHGLSLADQIELARKLGMLPPQVRLLGFQARGFALGRAPSPALRRQARIAAARIARLAGRAGPGFTV